MWREYAPAGQTTFVELLLLFDNMLVSQVGQAVRQPPYRTEPSSSSSAPGAPPSGQHQSGRLGLLRTYYMRWAVPVPSSFFSAELSAPVRSRPTTSQKIHPSRSSALLPPFIGLSIYLSILTNKSNLIDPSCVTRSSPIISNELGSSCRHYYPNMDASNYILTWP